MQRNVKHPAFTEYQRQLVKNWPNKSRLWSLCSLQLGRDATDNEVRKFAAERLKADPRQKAHWAAQKQASRATK